MIVDIAAANPETPITVWCHEETPYIWGDLLRELTAHDPATVLEGGGDMLERIMSPEGVDKLDAFLDGQSGVTRDQRNAAITAFMDAYAAEPLEAEIDLPGWTAETVAELTAAYDEDAGAIADLATVTMIRA